MRLLKRSLYHLQPYRWMKATKAVISKRHLNKLLSPCMTMIQPTTLIPKQVGNMYTASLYAAFASLLHNKNSALAGKRVMLFSYGSGLTATMFSLKLNVGQHPFSLSKINSHGCSREIEVKAGVPSREICPNNAAYGAQIWWEGLCDEQRLSLLAPGTYYLTEVDSMYRRFYVRKSSASENGSFANGH